MLLVWSCGFARKMLVDPAKAEPATVSESVVATSESEQVPIQQARAVQSNQDTQQPVPVPVSQPAQAPSTVQPQTASAVQVAQAPTPVPTQPSQPLAMTQPAYVQSVPATTDDNSMDRVEHRKIKSQRFAAAIDSLVISHAFRFLPNSMQELPGGWTQLIYNELYFIGVFKDHVEVHMPTIRGNEIQYFEILNFDTFAVRNYQTAKTQYGWNVSFNLTGTSDSVYTVNMLVYTLTGETVLNLLTLSNTIRYVGYIQPLNKN